MDRLYPHLKSTNKLLQIKGEQKHRINSAIRQSPRQKIIEKYLDPDSGLLDKLLGSGLLTWEEFDDIRTTGSQRSKNEKLLNIILSRDVYQQFLNLLNETQHSHLVDYKSDLDYYRRIVSGDIPLTTREEMILDMNREVIVELFKDSTQLAEQLHLQGVLSDKQLHRINSTSPTIEKTEMLFDVIRKRSLKDFQTTIRCLRAMRQRSHVADILEGGVTGRVTCRFESGAESVDEDAIVSRFINEFNKREYQMDGSESNSSLIRLGLSYVTVRPSNGIVLYFHFRSLEELQSLRTEFDSGSLRQKVEQGVGDLTTLPTDKMKLTVEWSEHDYQRCTMYFILVPSTTVNDLPLEVLDMILQRAVQFLKLLGDEANNSNFMSLASVSYCWSQRLSKSFLKKTVHRNYNAEIQKVEKRSAILRNNREYLVNEIQPNDLIPQLIQSGCLVEKEASSIRRLPNNTDKNSELLRIARTFSSPRHFQFVECLFQTNQLKAARVVERDGVTVKMCITNEATPNEHLIEKDLVGKLQKMLGENSDEKLWPNKLLNTFSIYDIVILSAQQGRGVVELWLWCQSQESLERLRDTDEGELIKITEQLFSRFQSSSSVTPQNAYIDSSYFQFDVVVRRMSAKLCGSLHVKSNRSLSGVTSLRDKIYITIGSKVVIYDAEVPYRRLEKTIKVPGIRMIDSVELVSCTVNECLYINDPDTDAIWKVKPANDHELTKWLSNLNDIKVSTSSRGEVFVLDTNHSCPTVSIYTEDAVFQRTVPIPLRSAAYSIQSAAVEIMPEVVAVSFVFGDGNKIREGIVVARLNETGQVLREVEWRGLSNLTSLSVGRFIAAESDGSSRRLIVLDYQLYAVQVICMSNETGGSQWPRFLCNRREKRELVVDHVGHTDDYQLDVYKLNYDEECDA